MPPRRSLCCGIADTGSPTQRGRADGWNGSPGGFGIRPEDTVSEGICNGKAEWIRSHDPERTLYVGVSDDSLAFDAAACRGTPAIGSGVLEQKSDFYFLGLGLHAIRKLIESRSDRRRRAIRLVFAVAVFYNFVAVAFALAEMMNPLVAAIIMPISSVVTLLIAAAAPETSRRKDLESPARLTPASDAGFPCGGKPRLGLRRRPGL